MITQYTRRFGMADIGIAPQHFQGIWSEARRRLRQTIVQGRKPGYELGQPERYFQLEEVLASDISNSFKQMGDGDLFS